MARKARVKSSTGIYHVLIRAIANLPLFTDEEDYQIYTGILNDLQQQGRCEIYAYALFPTHVHLLVRDSSLPTKVESEKASLPIEGEPEGVREQVGGLIKRLAASYSYYYNVKYDHYGPIYMDRFKSNPVETKEYFLKVLDHIGSQQSDHKYTCHHLPSVLPKELSSSSSLSLLEFRAREKRITDSRLMTFLRQNYSFTNIGEFLQREKGEQQEVIKAAKAVGGSIRQITRLTGSPYQSVFQIK